MNTPPSNVTDTSRPRLFAMVTTKKSRDYTPHALRTFFECTPIRSVDRVVLINNDDPHASELLPQNAHQTELINNASPQGFSTNGNQMIARALMTESDLFLMNNDIIYTDNWLTPLLGNDHSILSPLSNREVQYAGSAVVVNSQHVATTMILKAPMELSEYLESPRMFQALAEAHRKTASGFLPLIVFPFFCVKLSLPILERVGKFDETFGRAGGEDYDYALRAWLSGFQVQFALSSYVLHFWGKSTWTAKSNTPTPPDYDTSFLERFKDKWGASLFHFVFNENDSEIRANPELSALRQSGSLAALISRMMKQHVELHIG